MVVVVVYVSKCNTSICVCVCVCVCLHVWLDGWKCSGLDQLVFPTRMWSECVGDGALAHSSHPTSCLPSGKAMSQDNGMMPFPRA